MNRPVEARPERNLKVLCDGPLRPVLPALAEQFRQRTGGIVELAFAPAPVIASRVTNGEFADVLIVRPDENRELVKNGKVLAEGQEVVARIGTGIFVRESAPASDISNPDAFKRTILSADTICFNNVGSGIAFGELLQRLGITEIMRDKIVRVPPDELVESVLSREGNDIGAATMSLILDLKNKGLKPIGPLPEEYQSYLVLSAAVMVDAPSPDAARQFIQFLVSSESRTAFAAAGAL